ncbi:Uncharacterized protein Adt_22689 [Abeliophyllum distichum]|uniref:Uncharacterized protein n=1 Tax=Abeliophyllum distichum TaxID=126358 RepID=A0ABD1SC96_9LAMI
MTQGFVATEELEANMLTFPKSSVVGNKEKLQLKCAHPKEMQFYKSLRYLTHAIERLEKNQATTRHISDSEAESPTHDKSRNHRVKRRLDFSEKPPFESKEGENRSPSLPKRAATQLSVSVFDRLGHPSQVPPIPSEQKIRRKKEAPSMVASSVQNTPDDLELMRRRLAKLKAKQKSSLEEYTMDQHSPFSEDILVKPLPEPQLTSYEDDNDPVGHLDRYLLDGTPRSQ